MFTGAEVAKIFGVGEESVRRWIRCGKMKASRAVGRGGNSISLGEINDFVNHTNISAYRERYKKWLEERKIPYLLMDENGWLTSEELNSEDADFFTAMSGITKEFMNNFGKVIIKGEEHPNEEKSREEVLEMLCAEQEKLVLLMQEAARINKEIDECNEKIECYKNIIFADR